VKFDEIDKRMRVFETAHDHRVIPGIFIVVRVEGRNFTRLTRELHRFDAPFDERFRDYMISTTEHLMNCGFRVAYGYTQSDEISLLLHHDEDTFGRKTRKLESVFAGEASAKFSLLLGDLAAFDARVSQLPSLDLVVDYFRWRSQDAHRDALNGHCYWALRDQGRTAREAADLLLGLSVAAKNELLFQVKQVNFNDLPRWQKAGVGLTWEDYGKDAVNPTTGETLLARRRRIQRHMDLPIGDAYSQFVRNVIAEQNNNPPRPRQLEH
jgi:tRNA(His) 5'-end guanylyltransferase